MMRSVHHYRERGMPVFPVAGKIPLPGTRGVLDATTDGPGVEYRFRRAGRRVDAEGLPPLGVGVAAGHELRHGGGYLWVVDIDPRHDGDHTLAALEAEYGDLPETWTTRTPSGGWHYYYRTGTPHRNTAGAIGPGIDTRGRGGYVVAPMSPGYTLERGAEIAPAPGWLLARLRPRPRPATASRPIEPGTISPTVADAIGAAAAAIASAPEGTRNERLHVLAGAIAHHLIARGLVSPAEASEALHTAALAAGLPDAEIVRTIESAYRWRGVAD